MKKIYLLLIFTFLVGYTQAKSLLENEVTLSAKNQPLETVLDEISLQTGLTFSYNASAIDASELVSVEVQKLSAEKTLYLLLNERYEYKLRRKHVILKKYAKKIKPVEAAKKETQLLNDKAVVAEKKECSYIKNQVYVKNFCYSDSGTQLGDCPIITNDKKNEVMKKHLAILTLAIATSSAAAQAQDSTLSTQLNNIGKSFSSLVVEVSETTASALQTAADGINNHVAQARANNSSDTTQRNESSVADSAPSAEPAQVQPEVAPEKQEEKTATPEVEVRVEVVEKNAAAAAPAEVKTDSAHPFLLTFIYPFSFPELQPEKHTYNFSFNILAGYNGGVEGFELGYIANVNRYSMRGFQGAGITNVSLGNVEGIQLAGTVNMANNSKNNVQLAGITNFSAQGNSALQLAGVLNVANTASSQLSGVTNAARQADFQLAGVINASAGKNSTQLAGAANVADTSNFQLAGVINAAGSSSFQLSGLLNIASKSAGTQVGLVNIADTASGAMIGLVNIARRGGLRQAELSFSSSTVSAAYRLGTKKLYTFLEVSLNYDNFGEEWMYGFGFGTQIDFPNSWGMNVEVLHQNISEHLFWNKSYNGLSQLRVVGFKQLAKHFAVFAGPALYVYNSDREGSNPAKFKAPYALYSDHNGRYYNDVWVGATIGVRF
ncbi:MAG: hypothetical protein LBU92_05225 [Prevotellaceae bacterium]|jgi:hypothetical protein|nr:hypothetical protein [Prevotellaceae bacterium]